MPVHTGPVPCAQHASQSPSHELHVSAPVQNPSPQTAGQSLGHDFAVSLPVQQPSPHAGLQSAGQLQSLSVAEPADPPSEATLALGARVYQANCIQCHGTNGDGRGTAVSELTVRPTDFRRQQASLSASLRVLHEGMIGTRMALWTDRLQPDEIVAVAHYVRSLYQDASTQTEQRP